MDKVSNHNPEFNIKDSDAIYKTYFETASDAIFIMKQERFIECNSKTLDMYGCSKTDIINQTPYRFSPSLQPCGTDSKTKAQEHINAALTGKPQHFEWKHCRLDGTLFDVEVSLNSIVIESEIYLQAIVRDITQRKKAEHELRQSENKLRTLLENIPDGYCLLDAEGYFRDQNQAFEDIYGYPRKEILGKHILHSNIILHDQVAIIKDALELGFQRTTGPFELFIKHRDGSRIPVEVRTSPVTINHEQWIIVVSRDISQRKRIEKHVLNIEQDLKLLVDINQVLTHVSSEEGLLKTVCKHIYALGSYKLVWIAFAADDKDKTVIPVAQNGIDRDSLLAMNLVWSDTPKGQGPIGTAMRSGHYIVARDIHNNPEFKELREQALQYGYSSSIIIPLIIKDHVIGSLIICDEDENAFGDDEALLLQELTDDIAYGIHSQRLSFAQKENTKNLSQTMVQTIEAVALTVEKRDPYTAGHQDNVAQLSVAIGREIGLTEDQIFGLKLGATIHDLGKIYIPAEVLNRPGRLSEPEFEMIKSHPQVGYDIVKNINFPWPIAEMILQHHERLDGRGYPNGLKGDEIIIEAQILAVADVVEAISAHRPYRPALGIEVGMDEIKQGRGKIYNPDVVDACIKLIEKDNFTFTRTG
jgi:PAS domain S-box-containing protein